MPRIRLRIDSTITRVEKLLIIYLILWRVFLVVLYKWSAMVPGMWCVKQTEKLCIMQLMICNGIVAAVNNEVRERTT